MENYSTTQSSNLTVVAGAIVVLIAKIPNFASPETLTAEDIASVMASVGIIVAAVISFINRYKKGDLTLGGFRK